MVSLINFLYFCQKKPWIFFYFLNFLFFKFLINKPTTIKKPIFNFLFFKFFYFIILPNFLFS